MKVEGHHPPRLENDMKRANKFSLLIYPCYPHAIPLLRCLNPFPISETKFSGTSKAHLETPDTSWENQQLNFEIPLKPKTQWIRNLIFPIFFTKNQRNHAEARSGPQVEATCARHQANLEGWITRDWEKYQSQWANGIILVQKNKTKQNHKIKR